LTTTSQPPEQTRPGRDFLRVDDLAKDALVALNQKDITQYPAITKWCLQKFIEECLAERGQFREFFDKFATYTVDFVVNENLSANATKRDEQLRERFTRHIQVARFYDDMRERPPQIFLQDGGYDYTPSSLGGLSSGFATGDDLGSQNVSITDEITIPIEITAAALDEQIIQDLAAFLSAAFGSLGQTFTTRYILKPAPNDQGIYWEVRIPLQHRMSAKSHTPLKDDSRMQIWSVTCSLDIVFENSAYVYYRNDPRFQFTNRSSALFVPDKIQVGTVVPINFQMEPAISDVKSSDHRVAIIYKDSAHGTRYFCKAKKLGRFTIQVMAFRAPEGATVLLEKEVQVVVR
jgi:hypothetical protein